MKKIIMLITLLGLFSNGYQSIFAQKSKSRCKKNDQVIKELNLSEEQMEKFKSLKFKLEQDKIEMEAQLKMINLEMRKLFNQDDFEETELLKLFDNAHNIRGEILKSKLNFWINVRKILNDDQIETWKKHFRGMGIMQDRMRQFKERRFMGDIYERGSRHNSPRTGRQFGDF